ncbi:MAG TPA: hypothetical protein VMM58_13730 [Bacteroidota bacterium]|nr:hypothetical protein [Bacteroidota bacterium]
MKSFLSIIVAGVCFANLSFGQDSTKVSAAHSDSTAIGSVNDLTHAAMTSADSSAKKQSDTIAVSRDTSLRAARKTADTTVARGDTTSKEPQVQMPEAGELKSLANTPSTLDPGGYRDARWGMAMRDVRDYLVDHDNVDDDNILDLTNGFEYTGSLAGVKCRIAYQFDNDRLFIVRLTPEVKATSKFDFLDSFDDYSATLEAKYGKPTRSGFHKIDESYLNTIESIQLGYAKKYALWEFDRSYVVLILTGQKGKLEIHITYVSRAIFEEMKNRIESLKLEDF